MVAKVHGVPRCQRPVRIPARSGCVREDGPRRAITTTARPQLLRQPARLAGSSLLRLQSDERLAALAADGHEGAFATLVQRHRAALVRSCAPIVGPARAEDAVQQALMNAHAALRAGDEVRHPRAWLHHIARNAALNVLRSIHDEVPFEQAEVPDPRDGPAAAFERTERLEATLVAVRGLPERQRAALLLRELEGRSHEEIGSALGVTAGAARQHLMRARATVRSAITAVTPYPLLSRLMDLGASSPSPPVWLEGATGAAAGLTLTKVAVSVVATGALVGGTVGGARQLVAPAGPHHAAPAPARSVAVTPLPGGGAATARIRLAAALGSPAAVALSLGTGRVVPVAAPRPAAATQDLPVASGPAALPGPQADDPAPGVDAPVATAEPPAATPFPAPSSSSDATERATPPPPAATTPDVAADPTPAPSPPAATTPADPASTTVPTTTDPPAATPPAAATSPATPTLPDQAPPPAQANVPESVPPSLSADPPGPVTDR
jgi:RNA polymerase sigma factor (sigma-70 family)